MRSDTGLVGSQTQLHRQKTENKNENESNNKHNNIAATFTQHTLTGESLHIFNGNDPYIIHITQLIRRKGWGILKVNHDFNTQECRLSVSKSILCYNFLVSFKRLWYNKHYKMVYMIVGILCGTPCIKLLIALWLLGSDFQLEFPGIKISYS